MTRCEKLSLTLTGADLFYGKIDLKLTHNSSCFFIVNHTAETEFIKKTAMDFILSGCKDFHFFGTYKNPWLHAFNTMNSFVFPASAYETAARISVYDSIEAFSKVLHCRISARSFIPHDSFLIYHDEELYRSVLSLLGIVR